MRLPFRDEFNDLFRQDRSIWLKMIGGAAAAALIAISATNRGVGGQQGRADFGAGTQAMLLVVMAFLGAGVAFLLSLKDVVERRQAAGQRVSWLLRVYFGCGLASLLVWVVTSMGIAVPAIIVLFGHMGL